MKLESSNSPANNTEVNQVALIWICSIIASLLVYLCAALLITSFYHPDIDLLKFNAAKILIGSSSVRPEPVESLLFRTAIVFLPCLEFIFYRVFSISQKLKVISQKPVAPWLISLAVMLIAGLITTDFMAPNPFAAGGGDIPQTDRDDTGGSNFNFYFSGLFLADYFLLYSLVLVPLIGALFFTGFKKYNWHYSRRFNLFINIAGYTLVAAVIIVLVAISTFNFPYTTENRYDFGAVYYSVTQVYAGVPMLVNGFTNTYGLYPHFLNPLFQIMGLDVFKFSLVMSLILGLSLVLNFYCLTQYIRNKVLLFAGIFTIMFITIIDFEFTEAFDANFALHSIRYIIPSALLFLITLYLKNRSKFIYWLTSVIMAFFVLWNPEFGIVSYISWIAFNTYNDFSDKNGKIALKKIIFHWVTGLAVLIFAIYTFKCLILLFYGADPDMSALWTSILVFGNLGFGMLPMKIIHPWNLVALIIISGLVYAISKFYKKDITPKASVIFFLSVISSGIFIYFQGRSHNWNLALSSGMVLILLTFLGDELWSVVSTKNNFPLNALFIVFLYIISFSFFEVITHTSRLYDLVTQENDKEKSTIEKRTIENSKQFLLDNSEPGQKIYVFTLKTCQALFFDGSKRAAAFNPGILDLDFTNDVTRLENQVLDSSFNLFITPGTFDHMPHMSRTFAAIAATYEYNKNKEGITLALKRKNRIPSAVFFSDSSNQLLHRKYTDDRAGAVVRVNDAFGAGRVKLTPIFSVEILFYSLQQIFPMATLVGNSDTTGFVISARAGKCVFGFNGKGYILPIPLNQWVYCVLNVYPDHYEIFENGVYVYNHLLAKPLLKPDDDIFIGNMGNMHYYTGAISEVGINNRSLDSEQITRTWNEIRTVIFAPR